MPLKVSVASIFFIVPAPTSTKSGRRIAGFASTTSWTGWRKICPEPEGLATRVGRKPRSSKRPSTSSEQTGFCLNQEETNSKILTQNFELPNEAPSVLGGATGPRCLLHFALANKQYESFLIRDKCSHLAICLCLMEPNWLYRCRLLGFFGQIFPHNSEQDFSKICLHSSNSCPKKSRS